jgi:hypothetical protein
MSFLMSLNGLLYAQVGGSTRLRPELSQHTLCPSSLECWKVMISDDK